MKSLILILKRIRDVLNEAAPGIVYHYTRPAGTEPPFIVWQEDYEDSSLHADYSRAELQVHGMVNLYTATEYDPLCDSIQEALDSAENVGWRLDSVIYEDETNLIHYTWEWWAA